MFEKHLFNWFDSMGEYLHPKVGMDALTYSQPEDEEEKWIDSKNELQLDFLSLFKSMASDGHKKHKTGEGLSDFQNCLIPNKRLSPQGLVTGCATGARMAVVRAGAWRQNENKR